MFTHSGSADRRESIYVSRNARHLEGKEECEIRAKEMRCIRVALANSTEQGGKCALANWLRDTDCPCTGKAKSECEAARKDSIPSCDPCGEY